MCMGAQSLFQRHPAKIRLLVGAGFEETVAEDHPGAEPQGASQESCTPPLSPTLQPWGVRGLCRQPPCVFSLHVFFWKKNPSSDSVGGDLRRAAEQA